MMSKLTVLSMALLAGVSAQTTTTSTGFTTLPAAGTLSTTGQVYTAAPTTTVGTQYTTLPATQYYTGATTTLPSTQYVQTAQPQIQYVQAPAQQTVQYVQAPATQTVQYVQAPATQQYVAPAVTQPQFPQPTPPKRMTGPCFLYDQSKPSQAAVSGVIVYAISVRELPFCLVANDDNCKYTGGIPATKTDADKTTQRYKDTQYYVCSQWRATDAGKKAIVPTKARCSTEDSTSTDEFQVADVAACKKAGFPTL